MDVDCDLCLTPEIEEDAREEERREGQVDGDGMMVDFGGCGFRVLRKIRGKGTFCRKFTGWLPEAAGTTKSRQIFCGTDGWNGKSSKC